MSTKKIFVLDPTNVPIRTAQAAAKKTNPKKATAIKKAPRTSLASLADELQCEVLVHVPFEHLSQLRLVCSQWNKLTKSDAFGKALCTKTYGNNVAPLRVSDLASLSVAADSDLFLIPTVTKGESLSVNWLKYLELRSLFQNHIDSWKEEIDCSKESELMIPTSSELSYSSFKTMLDDHFHDCYSQHLTPLLLKMVPLLVQYKRIEVARLAVSILTTFEREGCDLQSSEISYVRLVKGLLDVLALSPIHFPAHVKKVFNIIMEHTRCFTEAVATGNRSEDSPQFYRQVFKQVLVAMVHEGARGPLQSNCAFKEYFQQPWHGCYQKILSACSTKPEFNFHADIVPTCRDEFKNSTDWRVRASALAVCHVSSYAGRRDKISFALTVLGAGDGNHNEVRRAAFFSIYLEMKDFGLRLTSLAPFLFKSLFTSFVDAIAFLSNEEKPLALAALKLLMVEYDGHSYTEEMLLKLHQNIFQVLLIPDVITATKPPVHMAIIEHIMGICAVLKQRAQKYLECYQAVLTVLVKSNVACPEAWLALYIDVGCMIGSKEFLASAVNLTKKIEAETFDIGVPIRKSHFLACCKSAQNILSCSQDQLIESVLRVFPPYVLDVLDPVVEPDNGNPYDYSSLSSDEESEDMNQVPEAMDIVDETPRGPSIVAAKKESDYEKPPAYLPHKKEQWSKAVAALAKAKGHATINKLFTFQKPVAKPIEMHKFIQPLDMSTRKETTGASLKATMCTPEAEGVVEKIIKWSKIDDDNEDEDEANDEGAKLKFAQRFLHVMIARMMSGPVDVKHLQCVSNLLETLEPHLDDKHLTRYLTIVVQILVTTKVHSPQVILELDEFQEFVLNMLETRVPDVDPELLIAMLKLRRDDPARGGFPSGDVFNIILRTECLDILTTMYPRAAWTALRSNLLLRKPFFNVCDERLFLQRLWQVKMFGLKGLADLQQCPANEYLYTITSLLKVVEKNPTPDHVLMAVLPKMKLYCELCKIDSDIAELNFYNQFLFDQDKLKNALIKANKYPGKMKYYSELLF